MAEYDITQKLIPFIDRHLAFPVLAHLLESSLFPEEDVRSAQYELAKGTNMVDFTLDLFQQLYTDQDPPPGSLSLIIRSTPPTHQIFRVRSKKRGCSRNKSSFTNRGSGCTGCYRKRRSCTSTPPG